MADIAMLVAEEYERRMKTSRKLGVRGGTDATTTAVAVGGGLAALAAKLREVNWVNKAAQSFEDLEPRNQMGAAAFSGFFSA